MAQFDTCTLQITGRVGFISFNKLSKKKQQWIADALLDMFTVDDASFDEEKSAIRVQNWNSTIDIEILRKDLNTLFEEKEYRMLLR